MVISIAICLKGMLVVVGSGRPEFDCYSRLLLDTSGIMNLRLGGNAFNTAYVNQNVVLNSNVSSYHDSDI
jgi:hypothetical protein